MNVKRGLSLMMALWLVCCAGIGVFGAAKDPVTLSVSNNIATVTLNESTLASVPLYNTDVRLQTSGDKLSLRFNTASNRTQSVELSDSRVLNINGDLRALSVASAVPEETEITVGDGFTVSSLTNYSPAKIIVNGSVGELTLRGASPVTVNNSGLVTTARMFHQGSSINGNGAVETAFIQDATQVSVKSVGETQLLNANNNGGYLAGNNYYSYYRYYDTPNVGNDRAGLYVDHTEPVRSDWTHINATNNMTKNGMYFEIAPIDVISGTLLRQLYAQLANNVRVTSTSTGQALSGRIVWLEEETTRVTRPGYYRFMFIPDNTVYPSATASVYLGLENQRGPYNVQLLIDHITYYYDPYYTPQLWELQSELLGAVTAYIPNTQRPVSGVFQWDSPNTYVRGSGWHAFTFIPDDTSYRTVSGQVYIRERR